MTEFEFEFEQYDPVQLLVAYAEELSKKLTNAYEAFLKEKIEFEAYDKETEVNLLKTELSKLLKERELFLSQDISADLDTYFNLSKIKSYSRTGCTKYLEEFVVESVDTNNIKSAGEIIYSNNHFPLNPHPSPPENLLLFARPLIETIAIAFFSRRRIEIIQTFLKGGIGIKQNTISKQPSEENVPTSTSPKLVEFKITKSSEDLHSPYYDWKHEKGNSELYSFDWINTKPKIILYTELIENKLIDSKTIESEFIKVFSRSNVTNISNIVWLSTEVLLVYLLNNLKGLVADTDYDQRFAIASACFVKRNGEKFHNKQLAKSSYNLIYNDKNLPRHHAKIDKALSRFTKS
ncbi:hypothetical protein [Pontibacter populi]|uniref:Uncharacterized protein n=1 Tax=Pontibacter populi TaxID=890055 RepID=A0ABV1RY80_9BACT